MLNPFQGNTGLLSQKFELVLFVNSIWKSQIKDKNEST